MSTSALEPQRFVPEVVQVAAARPVLVESAGGYLRNVIGTEDHLPRLRRPG